MTSDILLEVDDRYIDCGMTQITFNFKNSVTTKIPKSDVDYTQILANRGGTLNMTSILNFDVVKNEQCKLIHKMQRVYNMILKNKTTTDDEYANNYSFDITSYRDVTIDDINFSKLSEIGKRKTKMLAYNFYESFEDTAW